MGEKQGTQWKLGSGEDLIGISSLSMGLSTSELEEDRVGKLEESDRGSVP